MRFTGRRDPQSTSNGCSGVCEVAGGEREGEVTICCEVDASTLLTGAAVKECAVSHVV